MDLGGAAVKARDAVRPQPVVNVGVVARPEEGLGVPTGEPGIQKRNDRNLVLPPTTARMPRIAGSAKAALMSAARSADVAPTWRVVGYSTGMSPVTSVSRPIACSCTAGKAPATGKPR